MTGARRGPDPDHGYQIRINRRVRTARTVGPENRCTREPEKLNAAGRDGAVGRGRPRSVGRGRPAGDGAVTTQQYATLDGIGAAVTEARDPSGLLSAACRVLVGVAGYRIAWAVVLVGDDPEPVTLAWAGVDDREVEELLARAPGEAAAPVGAAAPVEAAALVGSSASAGAPAASTGPVSADPQARCGQVSWGELCGTWQAGSARGALADSWTVLAAAHGCCSQAVLDLASGERERAFLTVYRAESAAEAFPREQRDLLCSVARDVGFGLRMLRAGERHRAAEAELRAAQRYTRSLIEASLDPLVTISPAGTITDVNDATVRATGVPRERLIGSDFADYFTEPEQARAGYRRVFERGYVVDYPLALRHASGAAMQVLYNASVYRDADGVVAGVFAAARDVTELNRAAAASARLAAIVESSEDAILSKSLDGTVLSWNPGAERLYGYSADEIVGKSISLVVPPDRLEELREVLGRAGAGQRVHHFETVRQPRHGPPLDVSLAVSPLRDASGTIVAASTIARDITAGKRADAELRAASAYNRSLIEASIDPLVTIGPAGLITDVNAATETMTGCSRGELIGTEFSDYFTDPDLARAGFQRVFREGTVRDYALELRHRDGHATPVLYNASVYRDPSGQVLGVFAAARDVTRQRAAEAEVRALNIELEARVRRRTADLERANSNLEAFTYSVSHDLRAPLRALSGFSEALLEEYADHLDETGRQYAERIEAASLRMARLIDDLLHLSQVSRAQMHLQPVELSREVASITEDLQRREPHRRVRVVIQPEVRAVADRHLIRTVLENLLGNAWKFTSARAEASIEFGTLPCAEAAICCYVRDDGAGFDDAYLDMLFQPFQRLHTSQQFPGTGVGLASVRRIVERHGGRTWAEGSPDHGATFYFTLNPPVPG